MGYIFLFQPPRPPGTPPIAMCTPQCCGAQQGGEGYASLCSRYRRYSHFSPVFCTAKYRGGVRRTEGLKNTIKIILGSLFQPLSSETTVPSVSPLYFALQKHPVRLRNAEGKRTIMPLRIFLFISVCEYKREVKRESPLIFY